MFKLTTFNSNKIVLVNSIRLPGNRLIATRFPYEKHIKVQSKGSTDNKIE